MDKKQREIREFWRPIRVASGTEVREDHTAFGSRSATELLREIFFGILYAVGGYLLGTCTLPFGVRPLGVAWLCAAERRVLYLFVGLCLSALGSASPLLNILFYAGALVIRVAVRMTVDKPWERGERSREHTLGEILPVLFREQLALRMLTATVAVFGIGTYRLWEGEFLFYDLYGTLLAMVAAPIFVLLVAGIDRPVDARRPYVRTLGALTLACAIVYATREWQVAYVSVGCFGAMVMTLAMTRRRGIVTGALTGMLCGLAYLPVLAPLFVFGALCGGLLLPTSATLAALMTVTVGSAWALYARGLAALSGVLPGILVGSVLYFVVDRLFLQEKDASGAVEETVQSTCAVLSDTALDRVRLFDTLGQIKTLCEGFSSMAEIFLKMGNVTSRPTAEEIFSICEEAFDSSCASCPEREKCREAHVVALEGEMANLSSILFREGRVSFADVSEALVGRCARLPDILDEMNHNTAMHASRVLQGDKSEIFAADYAALADILAEAAVRGEEVYVADVALSQRLAECLSSSSLGVIGVTAWGKERPRVLVRYEGERMSALRCGELASLLSKGLGMPVELRRHTHDEVLGEAIFAPKERLSLSYAYRTMRADGEAEYCGDSVGVFGLNETKYALISDGMGSGREAAMTSGLCSLFLQKMLCAGCGCETALRLLNVFLRNKGSGSLHECSATVDLASFDLLEGRATFYKCGAAPTYVFREGGLFKIRSKTLPIGILSHMDQKRMRFDLCSGDVVVMVSDGITQGQEECLWLFELLRQNLDPLGIERMADLVIQYAKEMGAHDDLSVLILRVESNGEASAHDDRRR